METVRQILINADDEEISTLADFQGIKEKVITLSNERYPQVNYLLNEIRLNGGNTFANKLRGEGVEYEEIVSDVAKNLKVSFSKETPTDILEFEIVKKVIADNFKDMSDEQKREILESVGESNVNIPVAGPAILATVFAGNLSGFAIYKLSVIAANAAARAILGRGLAFAANATITRTLGVALGPAGWALGAGSLAFSLAGPAYRKTIPTVLFIAMLRQKYRNQQAPVCNSCGAPQVLGNKFCGECGTKY